MQNKYTSVQSRVFLLIISITMTAASNHAIAKGDFNIIGTWSHCNQFDKTSTEFKWTFTGMSFVSLKADFPTNDCSGASYDGYQELYSGSYVIGVQDGVSADLNTMEINLTVERAFAHPIPNYPIYTIFSVNENVLYLGDTMKPGADGFSRMTRPHSLQIIDGDYKRIE